MTTSQMYALEIVQTPVGTLTITADSQAVRGVHFGTLSQLDSTSRGTIFGDGRDNLVLQAASAQLADYFSGKRQEFDLPLFLDNRTPFQRKVLNLTRQIPFGSVLSYGELALQADSPGAARAVGAAMAGNPIPIIIPCHRVVGSDRSLHGYAAPDGIHTKAILLQLEGHPIVAYKLA